jgi:hypothetical protein
MFFLLIAYSKFSSFVSCNHISFVDDIFCRLINDLQSNKKFFDKEHQSRQKTKRMYSLYQFVIPKTHPRTVAVEQIFR